MFRRTCQGGSNRSKEYIERTPPALNIVVSPHANGFSTVTHGISPNLASGYDKKSVHRHGYQRIGYYPTRFFGGRCLGALL